MTARGGLHVLGVAAMLVAGCSSSDSDGGGSPAAELFSAPTGAGLTPDSILGVWSVMTEEMGFTADQRVQFTTHAMTSAIRCTFPNGQKSGTHGVVASARVTEDEVTTLESKEDVGIYGEYKCGVSIAPREIPRCTNGRSLNCFVLDGTKLEVYGQSGETNLSMIKISD